MKTPTALKVEIVSTLSSESGRTKKAEWSSIRSSSFGAIKKKTLALRGHGPLAEYGICSDDQSDGSIV